LAHTYTKEKYATLTGLSVRSIERRIQKKTLDTIGSGKNLRIVTSEFEKLPISTGIDLSTLLPEKKEEWNKYLKIAAFDETRAKEITDKITEQVNFFKKNGVKVVGYDYKSLRRKIKDGIPQGIRLGDKGVWKNPIVKRMLPDIMDAARRIFFGMANPSYELVTDLIIDEAKNNLDIIEIAAIPKWTLYRVIKTELQQISADLVHMYKNHANIMHGKLGKNHGASNDFAFGDYIVGDDNDPDVYRIPEFDEIRSQYKNMKLHCWFWQEAKSRKVLSYVIKTSEITTEDLKISFLEAIKEFGLPKLGVLIDNGIGRSAEFQHFLTVLTLKIFFAKPYCPTHKSWIERMFKIFKDEHSVFYNNYTGSNHAKEGRHKNLTLTPEAADYTVPEFCKVFEHYLNNFYLDRPRDMIVSDKTISIREFYNQCMETYIPIKADEKLMRYAFMRNETVKMSLVDFKFKGEYYIPKNPIAHCFAKKTLRVAYNPLNMQEVDLYSSGYFVDTLTGAIYNDGDYIVTCTLTRKLAKDDRQELVSLNNRDFKKNLARLADDHIDKFIIMNPHLRDSINSTVNANGKIINTRKKIKAEVKRMLEHGAPLENIGKTIMYEATVNSVDDIIGKAPATQEDVLKSLESLNTI
jgi:hypothetical protein